MRKLQRFCASLSLAIALSVTASAGDIHTGYTPPPPPPPPEPVVLEITEEDASSTTGATSGVNDATSADLVSELALALLRVMLLIF